MKKYIYVMAIVSGLSISAFAQPADEKAQSGQSDSQSNVGATEESSGAAGVQSEPAGAEKGGSKVTMQQLPQEVQKTIQAHSGGANVENIQQKTKNGQTVYTASYDQNNVRTQLTVAQDGSLLQFQRSQDVAIGAALPEIGKTSIKMEDLPSAVQDAIKQRAGDAQVGNLTKTSQQGKTIYHAGYNEGGIHTDLFVSEDGNLVAESQQTALFIAPITTQQKVSLNSVPQPVQKAIREQAGAGTITDIDKGQWQGKTVYKAMVQKQGKPMPIIVSESGQLLGGEMSEAAGAEQSEQQQQQPNDQQNKQ